MELGAYRLTLTPKAPRPGLPQAASRKPQASGFTLIETSLAMIIVSMGVLAIVQAQQAYIQHNMYSQRIGTGLLLANEVREMTMPLVRYDPITGDETWGPEATEATVTDFDDLDDFDGVDGTGVTFNPPIDANRLQVPNMTQWSQVVTVESVLENLVSGSAAPDNSTGVTRITCRVLYQGPRDGQPHEVTRLVWVRAGETE